MPTESQSDAGRDLLEAAREFYDRWSEFRMRAAGLPTDIREFCAREGLESCLCGVIEMARRFFPAARAPHFQLVRDPEWGDAWIAVRFAVAGDLTVNDIVERYNAFTDAWLDIAPEWVGEKIRVSFSKA